MRHRVELLAFFLVGSLWRFSSAAAPASETILAAEDARFTAMAKADTTALAGMLDDHLVYAHSTGKVESKSQFLTSIGSGSLRYLAITPLERDVILADEEHAVLAGRSRLLVTLGGAQMEFEARYMAVYLNTGEKWVLRAWQTTRIPPPEAEKK